MSSQRAAFKKQISRQSIGLLVIGIHSNDTGNVWKCSKNAVIDVQCSLLTHESCNFSHPELLTVLLWVIAQLLRARWTLYTTTKNAQKLTSSPFFTAKMWRKIWGGGSNCIILLRTSCLKMLAKMRPHRLKMHQKAFGGRAPPGPAGGA